MGTKNTSIDLSPFQDTTATINRGVIGREAEIMVFTVAILGGFNAVLIGAPGTAKSMIAKLLCEAYAPTEKHSTWLFHPQLTADEVIGGADLETLVRDKRVEHRWAHSIGDAKLDVVILEELFNATGGALTTMMTALNEGYIRGVDGIREIAATSFIGVTNEFPSGIGGRRRRGDIDMSALWDRFHLRLGVDQLTSQTALCDALLARSKGRPAMTPVDAQWVTDVRAASARASEKAAGKMTLRERVAAWTHKVREEGLQFTDRRAGILLDVAATYGVLHGREIPSSGDLQWAALRVGFEGLDSISIMADPEVSNLLIPELPTPVADFMTEARIVHEEVEKLHEMAKADRGAIAETDGGAEQFYMATKNRVTELNQSLATLKAAGHGGFIDEAGFPEIRASLLKLLEAGSPIKTWAQSYNW